MIQIKPVSDLRNKFPDIEKLVNKGEPVYLTKNGYGSITDGLETALYKADAAAQNNSRRYSHEEVFEGLRRKIND